MLNGLRLEVVVCFVDISGIVDHHFLSFLFICGYIFLKMPYEQSTIANRYTPLKEFLIPNAYSLWENLQSDPFLIYDLSPGL